MSEKNFMSYGDAETVFSEYANAIKTKSGTLYADAPIGAIIPYGGSTAPGGWLLCQGQAVSRTTYAALFSAIGTAFGEGDGSTTFNVPDLREAIPVGTGTRASGVTAHDTYTVGQFKDDQMQNHDHYRYPNNRNGWSLYADSVGDQGYGMFASDSTSYDNGSYTGNVHTGRTGTTTHGKQLGVNYIIKAVQSALPLDITAGVEDMLDEVKAVIPSNASASNQVLVKSDLTSSVTSGSTAPITSDGVAGNCPYKVFSDYSNEGNVITYTLANGGHYECKVYYYDGLCGIYDMVRNQFGNNGGRIATVWDDSVFKNYTISIEQSTGVVSMSGTAADNVQFVITALP